MNRIKVAVHVWIHTINRGEKREPIKRIFDEKSKKLDHARIAALTRAHIWLMEMT